MVSTNKHTHISSNKNLFLYSTLALTTVTSISALTLISSSVSADDVVDNVSITVPVSCTMSGTGMNTHTAEVVNSTYRADIGTTTIKAFCNDPNGFSIYAIGFTGDEYTGTNHTKLVGTSASGNATIATGTATSGSTSNWAMKLATNAGATYPVTLQNGYGSYKEVPDTYTRVAQRTSGTDTGTSATGAELTTTYAAFVSSTQPADTYVGKVKYTMVHPYDASTPEPTYDMQNLSIDKCPAASPINVVDVRDGEVYKAQRLADGKCWLLDNLRLDLSDADILANVTETNTNASATSLGYLKNGGGTTSDQYAITGVVEWTDSPTYASGYSYSDPLIATSGSGWSKDTTTTSYGNGSGKIGVYYNYCAASAGSYCYGNSTSYSTSTGDATEDLCPAGWRMPSGGSAGEYQALYTAYNSDATIFRNALSTPLPGIFFKGSAIDQGTGGFFWSSTRYSDYGMYILVVVSSNVNPAYNSGRGSGYSMRCLLDS